MARANNPQPRSRLTNNGRRGINPGDRLFAGVTLGLATLVVATLVMVTVLLVRDSAPAFAAFGANYIVGSNWNPVEQIFGALPFIYGTVVTSLIALLLATPFAVGAALFLAEYAPDWLREPVGFTVELLAAIPSIIYGLWGLFILAPVMRSTVSPALRETVGQVPVVGALFSGTIIGRDLLTAGIILAIMILPTIMSISREIVRAVPDAQREGMLGLGATRFEVIRTAVLPYAGSGIIGAMILGLARALGETMAVTLVVGNSTTQIRASLFTPGYTLASAIANQFNETDKPLYYASVVGLALILLLVSLVANLLARFLVRRVASGPLGARI